MMIGELENFEEFGNGKAQEQDSQNTGAVIRAEDPNGPGRTTTVEPVPVEDRRDQPAGNGQGSNASGANSKATVALKSGPGGEFIGETFEERYRLASIYAASRFLPAAFDTPAKVFTALQFAYELGLRGITALRNIYIVNGTPALWGDLPLAIVRNSGKLKTIKEWTFDADGKEISLENKNIAVEPSGAACQTERHNAGEVSKQTTVFTVADAKTAGVWGVKCWKTYPKRMLQLRARSQNLKDHFGDTLCGAAIAEHDFNVTGNERGEIEVESELSGAAKLNALVKTAGNS